LSGSKGNKKKIKIIIKSIKNLGTSAVKTVAKTSVAKIYVDNKLYVTKNFYIAKPTFS
jgi:hypothetical protein